MPVPIVAALLVGLMSGALVGCPPTPANERKGKTKGKDGNEPWPYNSGACFPGDTYVRTAAGGLITLRELAEQAAKGEPLPDIVSYDERVQAVVDQRPAHVIDHGVVHSTVLSLGLWDDRGRAVTPLRVTGEHPLLTHRVGVTAWVRAGELVEGDTLIGPGGESYTFAAAATVAVEGAFELYNLSFGLPDGQLAPTYLVSPDGTVWFIAHNVKFR